MFEVRLADHPRSAVRTAAVVRRSESIEAQHPQPAACEVGESRPADRTAAEHDDIIWGHGMPNFSSDGKSSRRSVGPYFASPTVKSIDAWPIFWLNVSTIVNCSVYFPS
jgi:hypothetical protein